MIKPGDKFTPVKTPRTVWVVVREVGWLKPYRHTFSWPMR